MSIAEAKCLSDSRNNIVYDPKRRQPKRLNVPVSTMRIVPGYWNLRFAQVAVSLLISDSAGSYTAVRGITPSTMVDGFDLGSLAVNRAVSPERRQGYQVRSRAAKVALLLAETAPWR